MIYLYITVLCIAVILGLASIFRKKGARTVSLRGTILKVDHNNIWIHSPAGRLKLPKSIFPFSLGQDKVGKPVEITLPTRELRQLLNNNY